MSLTDKEETKIKSYLKKKVVIVLVAFVLLMAVPAGIRAESGTVIDHVYEPPKAEVIVNLTIDAVETTVNGVKKTLDFAPFLKPGVNRTMVPIRFVSESLGASVKWDAVTRRVVVNYEGREIILTINSDIALVDGKEVKIDCPAEIVGNRTFVPVRFVAEALGATVHYEHETRAITIKRSFQF